MHLPAVAHASSTFVEAGVRSGAKVVGLVRELLDVCCP